MDVKMQVLFEGKVLKQDKFRKVWRKDNFIYGIYESNPVLFHRYEDENQPEEGLQYLLYKLGRISEWI